MGSTELVEAFPLLQFLVQINIISVRQELVELLFVRTVRSLYLAAELR